MLTEEKIRSGENMYHLISRTASLMPGSNYKGSLVHFRSAALVTPPPIGTTTTSPMGVTNQHFSTNFLANRENLTPNS